MQIDYNNNRYFSLLVERGNMLLNHWLLGGEFIHSAKNPIAGVLASSQVLLDEFGEEDERRILINEMINQLIKLDNIISNYSLFLKSLEPNLLPVSLGKFLDSLIPEIERSLQVAIEKHLAGTKDICLIDEVAASIAIYNLINVQCYINNSLEFSVSIWEDSETKEICLHSMPRNCDQATEVNMDEIEIDSEFKRQFELAIELLKRQNVRVQWKKGERELQGFTASFPSTERYK